jgi:excisionase family DNA binding protein
VNRTGGHDGLAAGQRKRRSLVPFTQISPGDSKLRTVAEIAGLLRVGTMTVYRMVNSGELKSVRIGRAIRVPEKALRDILVVPGSEDLTAWMNSDQN